MSAGRAISPESAHKSRKPRRRMPGGAFSMQWAEHHFDRPFEASVTDNDRDAFKRTLGLFDLQSVEHHLGQADLGQFAPVTTGSFQKAIEDLLDVFLVVIGKIEPEYVVAHGSR